MQIVEETWEIHRDWKGGEGGDGFEVLLYFCFKVDTGFEKQMKLLGNTCVYARGTKQLSTRKQPIKADRSALGTPLEHTGQHARKSVNERHRIPKIILMEMQMEPSGNAHLRAWGQRFLAPTPPHKNIWHIKVGNTLGTHWLTRLVNA